VVSSPSDSDGIAASSKVLLVHRSVAEWRNQQGETVPIAHTCQIFARSSKINHSNHVKTWAAKISAARPHIKKS
jgi:hypothetical protein